MLKAQDNRAGILLMLAAVSVFSVQDGLSRHLAGEYNVLMVVMIRYWVFALFVITLALRQPQGWRAAVRTRQPWTHLLRASLLIAEVCLIVHAYTLIGLANTHAVFACCPLIITALSGPMLGEKVGWQRWLAISFGFLGILVILQPGSGLFSLAALLPLASATMFALYSLLTRRATQTEPPFASLFWSGTLGAVLMTAIGIGFWEPMSRADWGWMLGYASLAVLANWLLIKCYEVAEASAVQPFAYLQLVFVSILGIVFFDEVLRANVVLGSGLVVMAGLVTIWQGRRQREKA